MLTRITSTTWTYYVDSVSPGSVAGASFAGSAGTDEVRQHVQLLNEELQAQAQWMQEQER